MSSAVMTPAENATQEVRVVLQLEESIKGRNAREIGTQLLEALKDKPFSLVHITVEEESAIYHPEEDRIEARFSREV